MANCEGGKSDQVESTFINFSKSLLKSFILLIVVVMVISLKKKLFNENSTLFLVSVFIVTSTLLFSLVSIVDSYVFSNLIIGIGLGLGITIMQ